MSKLSSQDMARYLSKDDIHMIERYKNMRGMDPLKEEDGFDTIHMEFRYRDGKWINIFQPGSEDEHSNEVTPEQAIQHMKNFITHAEYCLNLFFTPLE